MGVLDVLDISDWTIQEALYLSLLLTFVWIVGSYAIAAWWQAWKARRKRDRLASRRPARS